MTLKILFALTLGIAAIALVFSGYNAGIIGTSELGDDENMSMNEETQDREASVTVAGEEQDHEVSITGTGEHAHAEVMVDPRAPIVHLFALEFGYTPGEFKAKAGHAFTIMFHNEAGQIEHAVAIEGEEMQGGIHLQPGEGGMATFTLHEPGTYTYYCGVPGHREAGMVGTLVVEANDMAVRTGDMAMPPAESAPVVR